MKRLGAASGTSWNRSALAAALFALTAGGLSGSIAFAQVPAAAPAAPAAPAPAAAAPTAAATTAPTATAPAAAAAGTPPAAATAPASGADWMTYQNAYSGEENSLANPNRTQDEITSWAQQRATEVLSFTKDNIEKKTETQVKDFTAQGQAEYKRFLTDSHLFDMVRGQDYSVTTIANGDVLILNSAAINGAFHWLVELPLMITFLHTDAASGEQKPVAGGEYKLVIDIGRVSPKEGVDGMQIGSWKMEPKVAAAH